MGDPRPVESVAGLSLLVLTHLRQSDLVHLWILSGRDERGHASHGVRAAPVAGRDEQLGVRAHEGDGHRHLSTIGQDEVGPQAELLDRAEDVVPAAGVQPRRVLAELVEDLVHLERGEDRLDENRRPNRAVRDSQGLLGVDEDVVPEPGLLGSLELRQVEIRPAATPDRFGCVVEEVQPEVEEAGRDRGAIDEDVSLLQVPAAGPDEKGGDLLVEPVCLALGRRELELASDGVLESSLAADDVGPGRRQGILEVSHEDPRARIERVDHHLRLGGTGDLRPAIVQVRRRRRHAPVRIADRPGIRAKVGHLAGVNPPLALGAPGEELLARRVEPAVKAGDERQRLVCEDSVRPVHGCSDDVDTLGLSRHRSRSSTTRTRRPRIVAVTAPPRTLRVA